VFVCVCVCVYVCLSVCLSVYVSVSVSVFVSVSVSEALNPLQAISLAVEQSPLMFGVCASWASVQRQFNRHVRLQSAASLSQGFARQEVT
jgi:hypothetical protein